MAKEAATFATSLYQASRLYNQARDMYRTWNQPNPRQVTPTRSFPKFQTARRMKSSRSFTKSRSRTGKRSFLGKRKRNQTKRTIWKMKKKLRQVMIPAKALWLDALQGRVSTAQGTSTWLSLGNLQTQNSILTGFSGSAESVPYLLVGPINNDGTSGNNLGRAKTMIHSWEQIFRWTNQSNCPLTIECYTLKCKQNLHLDGSASSGLTASSTIKDFLQRCLYTQYGQTNVLNIGIDHPAFKLSDCAEFGKYFKPVKHKTTTVQPGESLSMRKFKVKPRTYDEAFMYDTVSSRLKLLAIKGSLTYLWRITGTPQSASAGVSATLCDVKLAYVVSFHYRTSGYSYNDYQQYLPTALPTGVSIENIYPGTSESKAAAPVP